MRPCRALLWLSGGSWPSAGSSHIPVNNRSNSCVSEELNTPESQGPMGEFQRVDIVDEMKTSYLDYAMSVIVSRALPDVRDGLKPVHRRILFASQEGGMVAGRPYRKSAKIVGDVMGNYHPQPLDIPL